MNINRCRQRQTLIKNFNIPYKKVENRVSEIVQTEFYGTQTDQ